MVFHWLLTRELHPDKLCNRSVRVSIALVWNPEAGQLPGEGGKVSRSACEGDRERVGE